MKFAKISILALTLGLFVASCGSGDNKTTTNDSTATTTATPAAPATDTPAAPAAAPVDTNAKKMDTTAKATTTKTETKMETKKAK